MKKRSHHVKVTKSKDTVDLSTELSKARTAVVGNSSVTQHQTSSWFSPFTLLLLVGWLATGFVSSVVMLGQQKTLDKTILELNIAKTETHVAVEMCRDREHLVDRLRAEYSEMRDYAWKLEHRLEKCKKR